MSFTVHSKKTSISRLQKTPIPVSPPTSPNLAINTTCASPDEGVAVTRVKLEKTLSSAGSSSAQAILPTSNVSLMVAQDPFLNLVAQNSGVTTNAALSANLVSDGDTVWAPAVANAAEKKNASASDAARKELRV